MSGKNCFHVSPNIQFLPNNPRPLPPPPLPSSAYTFASLTLICPPPPPSWDSQLFDQFILSHLESIVFKRLLLGFVGLQILHQGVVVLSGCYQGLCIILGTENHGNHGNWPKLKIMGITEMQVIVAIDFTGCLVFAEIPLLFFFPFRFPRVFWR